MSQYSYNPPDHLKALIYPQISKTPNLSTSSPTFPTKLCASSPTSYTSPDSAESQSHHTSFTTPLKSPRSYFDSLPTPSRPHTSSAVVHHPSLADVPTSTDYTRVLPGIPYPQSLPQGTLSSSPHPAPIPPPRRVGTEFLTRDYQKWDIFRIYQSLLYTYIECQSSNSRHRKLLRISRFPLSLYDLEIEQVNELVLLGIVNDEKPLHNANLPHSPHLSTPRAAPPSPYFNPTDSLIDPASSKIASISQTPLHNTDPTLPTVKLIASGIALIGFIRFELGYYLQLVVTSQITATIGQHDIHCIKSVQLIPLFSNDCLFACDIPTSTGGMQVTLPNPNTTATQIATQSSSSINTVAPILSPHPALSPQSSTSPSSVASSLLLGSADPLRDALSHPLAQTTPNLNTLTTTNIDPLIGDWVYSGIQHYQQYNQQFQQQDEHRLSLLNLMSGNIVNSSNQLSHTNYQVLSDFTLQTQQQYYHMIQQQSEFSLLSSKLPVLPVSSSQILTTGTTTTATLPNQLDMFTIEYKLAVHRNAVCAAIYTHLYQLIAQHLRNLKRAQQMSRANVSEAIPESDGELITSPSSLSSPITSPVAMTAQKPSPFSIWGFISSAFSSKNHIPTPITTNTPAIAKESSVNPDTFPSSSSYFDQSMQSILSLTDSLREDMASYFPTLYSITLHPYFFAYEYYTENPHYLEQFQPNKSLFGDNKITPSEIPSTPHKMRTKSQIFNFSASSANNSNINNNNNDSTTPRSSKSLRQDSNTSPLLKDGLETIPGQIPLYFTLPFHPTTTILCAAELKWKAMFEEMYSISLSGPNTATVQAANTKDPSIIQVLSGDFYFSHTYPLTHNLQTILSTYHNTKLLAQQDDEITALCTELGVDNDPYNIIVRKNDHDNNNLPAIGDENEFNETIEPYSSDINNVNLTNSTRNARTNPNRYSQKAPSQHSLYNLPQFPPNFQFTFNSHLLQPVYDTLSRGLFIDTHLPSQTTTSNPPNNFSLGCFDANPSSNINDITLDFSASLDDSGPSQLNLSPSLQKVPNALDLSSFLAFPTEQPTSNIVSITTHPLMQLFSPIIQGFIEATTLPVTTTTTVVSSSTITPPPPPPLQQSASLSTTSNTNHGSQESKTSHVTEVPHSYELFEDIQRRLVRDKREREYNRTHLNNTSEDTTSITQTTNGATTTTVTTTTTTTEQNILLAPRFVLIARRSSKFAGTRYLKRGLSNSHSDPANEVEQEQIVSHNQQFTAYTQLRGSIPLYWSQSNKQQSLVAKPDIEITNPDLLMHGPTKYWAKTISRYGSNIIFLNLIKKKESKPRESLLGDHLARQISELQNLRYINNSIIHIAIDYKAMLRTPISVVDMLGLLTMMSLYKTGIFNAQPSTESIVRQPGLYDRFAVSQVFGNNINTNDPHPHHKGDGSVGDIDFNSTLPPISPIIPVSAADLSSKSNSASSINLPSQPRQKPEKTTKKNGTQETIAKLTNQQHLALQEQVLHQDMTNYNTITGSLQNGIIRSNCIDNLDRTNISALLIAKFALTSQLQHLNIPSSLTTTTTTSNNGSATATTTTTVSTTTHLAPSVATITLLLSIFERMGDCIAMQYGGSQMHRQMRKESGKSQTMTPVLYRQQQQQQQQELNNRQNQSLFDGLVGSAGGREILISIYRHYQNSFNDKHKQDVINVFLGLYKSYSTSISTGTTLWSTNANNTRDKIHILHRNTAFSANNKDNTNTSNEVPLPFLPGQYNILLSQNFFQQQQHSISQNSLVNSPASSVVGNLPLDIKIPNNLIIPVKNTNSLQISQGSYGGAVFTPQEQDQFFPSSLYQSSSIQTQQAQHNPTFLTSVTSPTSKLFVHSMASPTHIPTATAPQQRAFNFSEDLECDIKLSQTSPDHFVEPSQTPSAASQSNTSQSIQQHKYQYLTPANSTVLIQNRLFLLWLIRFLIQHYRYTTQCRHEFDNTRQQVLAQQDLHAVPSSPQSGFDSSRPTSSCFSEDIIQVQHIPISTLFVKHQHDIFHDHPHSKPSRRHLRDSIAGIDHQFSCYPSMKCTCPAAAIPSHVDPHQLQTYQNQQAQKVPREALTFDQQLSWIQQQQQQFLQQSQLDNDWLLHNMPATTSISYFGHISENKYFLYSTTPNQIFTSKQTAIERVLSASHRLTVDLASPTSRAAPPPADLRPGKLHVSIDDPSDHPTQLPSAISPAQPQFNRIGSATSSTPTRPIFRTSSALSAADQFLADRDFNYALYLTDHNTINNNWYNDSVSLFQTRLPFDAYVPHTLHEPHQSALISPLQPGYAYTRLTHHKQHKASVDAFALLYLWRELSLPSLLATYGGVSSLNSSGYGSHPYEHAAALPEFFCSRCCVYEPYYAYSTLLYFTHQQQQRLIYLLHHYKAVVKSNANTEYICIIKKEIALLRLLLAPSDSAACSLASQTGSLLNSSLQSLRASSASSSSPPSLESSSSYTPLPQHLQDLFYTTTSRTLRKQLTALLTKIIPKQTTPPTSVLSIYYPSPNLAQASSLPPSSLAFQPTTGAAVKDMSMSTFALGTFAVKYTHLDEELLKLRSNGAGAHSGDVSDNDSKIKKKHLKKSKQPQSLDQLTESQTVITTETIVSSARETAPSTIASVPNEKSSDYALRDNDSGFDCDDLDYIIGTDVHTTGDSSDPIASPKRTRRLRRTTTYFDHVDGDDLPLVFDDDGNGVAPSSGDVDSGAFVSISVSSVNDCLLPLLGHIGKHGSRSLLLLLSHIIIALKYQQTSQNKKTHTSTLQYTFDQTTTLTSYCQQLFGNASPNTNAIVQNKALLDCCKPPISHISHQFDQVSQPQNHIAPFLNSLSAVALFTSLYNGIVDDLHHVEQFTSQTLPSATVGQLMQTNAIQHNDLDLGTQGVNIVDIIQTIFSPTTLHNTIKEFSDSSVSDNSQPQQFKASYTAYKESPTSPVKSTIPPPIDKYERSHNWEPLRASLSSYNPLIRAALSVCGDFFLYFQKPYLLYHDYCHNLLSDLLVIPHDTITHHGMIDSTTHHICGDGDRDYYDSEHGDTNTTIIFPPNLTKHYSFTSNTQKLMYHLPVHNIFDEDENMMPANTNNVLNQPVHPQLQSPFMPSDKSHGHTRSSSIMSLPLSSEKPFNHSNDNQQMVATSDTNRVPTFFDVARNVCTCETLHNHCTCKCTLLPPFYMITRFHYLPQTFKSFLPNDTQAECNPALQPNEEQSLILELLACLKYYAAKTNFINISAQTQQNNRANLLEMMLYNIPINIPWMMSLLYTLFGHLQQQQVSAEVDLAIALHFFSTYIPHLDMFFYFNKSMNNHTALHSIPTLSSPFSSAQLDEPFEVLLKNISKPPINGQTVDYTSHIKDYVATITASADILADKRTFALNCSYLLLQETLLNSIHSTAPFLLSTPLETNNANSMTLPPTSQKLPTSALLSSPTELASHINKNKHKYNYYYNNHVLLQPTELLQKTLIQQGVLSLLHYSNLEQQLLVYDRTADNIAFTKSKNNQKSTLSSQSSTVDLCKHSQPPLCVQDELELAVLKQQTMENEHTQRQLQQYDFNVDSTHVFHRLTMNDWLNKSSNVQNKDHISQMMMCSIYNSHELQNEHPLYLELSQIYQDFLVNDATWFKTPYFTQYGRNQAVLEALSNGISGRAHNTGDYQANVPHNDLDTLSIKQKALRFRYLVSLHHTSAPLFVLLSHYDASLLNKMLAYQWFRTNAQLKAFAHDKANLHDNSNSENVTVSSHSVANDGTNSANGDGITTDSKSVILASANNVNTTIHSGKSTQPIKGTTSVTLPPLSPNAMNPTVPVVPKPRRNPKHTGPKTASQHLHTIFGTLTPEILFNNKNNSLFSNNFENVSDTAGILVPARYHSNHHITGFLSINEQRVQRYLKMKTLLVHSLKTRHILDQHMSASYKTRHQRRLQQIYHTKQLYHRSQRVADFFPLLPIINARLLLTTTINQLKLNKTIPRAIALLKHRFNHMLQREIDVIDAVQLKIAQGRNLLTSGDNNIKQRHNCAPLDGVTLMGDLYDDSDTPSRKTNLHFNKDTIPLYTAKQEQDHVKSAESAYALAHAKVEPLYIVSQDDNYFYVAAKISDLTVNEEDVNIIDPPTTEPASSTGTIQRVESTEASFDMFNDSSDDPLSNHIYNATTNDDNIIQYRPKPPHNDKFISFDFSGFEVDPNSVDILEKDLLLTRSLDATSQHMVDLQFDKRQRGMDNNQFYFSSSTLSSPSSSDLNVQFNLQLFPHTVETPDISSFFQSPQYSGTQETLITTNKTTSTRNNDDDAPLRRIDGIDVSVDAYLTLKHQQDQLLPSIIIQSQPIDINPKRFQDMLVFPSEQPMVHHLKDTQHDMTLLLQTKDAASAAAPAQSELAPQSTVFDEQYYKDIAIVNERLIAQQHSDIDTIESYSDYQLLLQTLNMGRKKFVYDTSLLQTYIEPLASDNKPIEGSSAKATLADGNAPDKSFHYFPHANEGLPPSTENTCGTTVAKNNNAFKHSMAFQTNLNAAIDHAINSNLSRVDMYYLDQQPALPPILNSFSNPQNKSKTLGLTPSNSPKHQTLQTSPSAISARKQPVKSFVYVSTKHLPEEAGFTIIDFD